jgi:predicted transcriptional regulator
MSATGAFMEDLSIRILRMFGEMNSHRLDLHVLFEAAGNEPSERERLLSVVEELRREGLIEERGGDFYALTEKGEKIVSAGQPS